MELKTLHQSNFDWFRIWEVERKFVSEAIIFSLIQYPVHFAKHDTISWALFGILFFSSLLVMLFSRGQQERFVTSFCWCIIPIMIISKVLFSIPVAEIVLLFLFTVWRLSVFIKVGLDDDDEDFFGNRLVVTILIFALFYFISYTLQIHSRWTMPFFLLIQLFLFSFGTFFKRYLESKNESIYKKSVLLYGLAVLIIVIVLSLVSILIAAIFKHGMFIVLNKAFLYIAYLLSPILNSLIRFFGVRTSRLDKLVKEQKEKMKEPPMDNTHHEGITNPQDEHPYIFMFVVILLIGILVYWKFKKMKYNKDMKLNNSFYKRFILHKEIDEPMTEWKSHNYYSKSSEKIRKYVYELEDFAVRMKMERYSFESVRDWLKRLNIKVTNQWILLYEEVRYGMKDVTHQEQKKFLEEVKFIKREIKEHRKKSEGS